MKKVNFKKVFNGRNAVFFLLILAVVFLFGDLAFAGFGEWAGNVVGGIIGVFITALAGILMLLVRVLMDVAAYSDFINAPAITKGWVVVRDVCNMFFVVILLIIAFATILGQEEYGAKKMLPKLVMAAVLINFSKLFCGLMIDVASVVMLTFVNAFSAIGSGNMLDLLGIAKITSIDPNSGTITFATIVSAYIFGLIYVLIATVVVASMLGMLVMRIVMIWILTVLSPLAFFLQAVPGKGQQYASQWWSKWSSNLIIGPVIAFFLWLSFAALQGGSPITSTKDAEAEMITNKNQAAEGSGIGSEAGTVSQMAKFVIAIGMLLGGMKIAQEVGGETGSALGKGMNAINKGKSFAVGAVTRPVAWAGRGVASLPSKGKDAALGALARNDWTTNKLGQLGGAQGKGAFLYRNLATKAKINLESIDKKKRDKAKEYIGGVSDTRILKRISNETMYTSTGREKRSAARTKLGFHEEAGATKFDVNTMSREDLGKINGKQMNSIGQEMSNAGVTVAAGSEFENHLRSNSVAQRAYHEGVFVSHNAGTISGPASKYMVRRLDKNGAETENIGIAGKTYSDVAAGLIPAAPYNSTRSNFKYSKESDASKAEKELKPNSTTTVNPEQKVEARGKGNLSINEFAGQGGKLSNTVAVDFDKINLTGMEKDDASDFRNIKGVNTSDANAIREISKKMVDVIDGEIKGLKAKGGQMTKGDSKRLDNLSQAKERFSKPEKINNLNLVNSSAASYKATDVKGTKIHEEMHELGYDNEDDVNHATKQIIKDRNYETRKDPSSIDKIIGKENNQVIPQPKSVNDILKNEKDRLEEPAEINTENLNKIIGKFEGIVSKFSDDLAKRVGINSGLKEQSGTANFAKLIGPIPLNYLFKQLIKEVKSNGEVMDGKLNNDNLIKNLGSLEADKASTPLEAKVVGEEALSKAA